MYRKPFGDNSVLVADDAGSSTTAVWTRWSNSIIGADRSPERCCPHKLPPCRRVDHVLTPHPKNPYYRTETKFGDSGKTIVLCPKIFLIPRPRDLLLGLQLTFAEEGKIAIIADFVPSYLYAFNPRPLNQCYCLIWWNIKKRFLTPSRVISLFRKCLKHTSIPLSRSTQHRRL